MTNAIKEHPVSTGVFLSITTAKFMRNDKWYSHQLSNLELAKTIFNSSNMPESSRASLRNTIVLTQMKLFSVRTLSRISFLPLFGGMTAIYLDKRLTHRNGEQPPS